MSIDRWVWFICLREIIIHQQVAGGNAMSIIVLLMIWDGQYMPSHGHAICLNSFNHD